MKSRSTIPRWFWFLPLFTLLAGCGGGGGGGNNSNATSTCVWGSSNWGGCSWDS